MNKYVLIGAKLGHSYSALIHNYVFKKYNLPATYSLLEVADLAEFVNYAKNNLAGFNVTIPYKEKIMPYLDYISLEAKTLANVNTVKIIDGKLYGYNTDYIGFLEMLKYYQIEVKDKDIYILGSGGAAKTCFKALAPAAHKIKMVSRSKHDENTISYEDLANANLDLVVNATPVGMYPNVDACPLSKELLEHAKEVVDLIYNPRQTKFLATKNSKHNGLVMLIIQALAADKIWLDINYDTDLIKEVGETFE